MRKRPSLIVLSIWLCLSLCCQAQISQPKPLSVGLIKNFLVTISTGPNQTGLSNAELFLCVTGHDLVVNDHSTNGKSFYLGQAKIDKNDTKTYSASELDSGNLISITDSTLGGLVVVAGIGGNADIEIAAVKIVGIDGQGTHWIIVDKAYPTTKWLKNTGGKNAGPFLPLETKHPFIPQP